MEKLERTVYIYETMINGIHLIIGNFYAATIPQQINRWRTFVNTKRTGLRPFSLWPRPPKKYYTFAWNKGPAQQVVIDEVTYDFPSNCILPLMIHQSFRFQNPYDIVAWQFNRGFIAL